MTYPTKLEAQDFFGQLRRFTRRLMAKALGGTPDESPNRATFRYGRPKGAILHYTASANWQSPVRWFNAFKEASAHVVVCDRLEPVAAGLADDLPLVKALPVTVIQCVPPEHGAWHARWANALCYGIENRNAGLVRRDNPGAPWRHWPKAKGSDNEWTAPAPVIPGKPYEAVSDTEGYEPYTRAQLATNVMLLRYVGAYFASLLEPHFVLPHSAIQGGKWDTGPLFPIHEIRRLACIDVDIDPAAALASFTDPEDLTSTDDLDVLPFQEARTDANNMVERDKLEAAIAALPHAEAELRPAQHPFAAATRRQLDRLGFFVPEPPDPRHLDVWLRRALWIFQTGAKLPASNEPDATTRVAILERLASLGLPA